MKLLISIGITLVLLFVFRLAFLTLYMILCKIFNVSNNVGTQMTLSGLFLIIYLQTWLGAVQGTFKNTEVINNIEAYLIYTFVGIAMIVWCYIEWDFEWKAIPKFGKNNKHMKLKKIIVFTIVMFFVFYQGYCQLNNRLNGEEVDLLVVIANITIVPGIIAFDRVLNQITSLLNDNK